MELSLTAVHSNEQTGLLRPTLRLAIPSILENAFQSAVFIVDAFMIAWVGMLELAAISIIGIFLWRLGEVSASLQAGTAAYVSRRWGEGRHDLARVGATHGMFLAFLIGITVAACAHFFAPPVLRFLAKGSEQVVPLAITYVSIVLLVFPFQQMRINLSASLRASGDTLTPSIATLLVNVLNIILNYILIFGKFGAPALGLKGAAISTALAFLAGWAFLVAMAGRGIRPRRLFEARAIPMVEGPEPALENLAAPDIAVPGTNVSLDAGSAAVDGGHCGRDGQGERVEQGEGPNSSFLLHPSSLLHDGLFRLTRAGLRPRIRGTTGRIVRTSLPTMLEEIIVSIGFFGFVRMISAFGEKALAAHSTVVRYESLSFMAGVGFAISASTLVGQSLGRGEVRTAMRAFQVTCLLAIVVMGFLGMGMCLFAEELIRLFRGDSGMMLLGVPIMILAGVQQPVIGTTMALAGGLRGSGDTLSPTISQLFGTFLVRLGLGYWLAFPMGMGVVGIYWATVVDWSLRTAILAYFVHRGKWRERVV